MLAKRIFRRVAQSPLKNLDIKRQLNYLERENIRRKFDKKPLEQTQFNFMNVISTGINLNAIECYKFPQTPTGPDQNTAKNSFMKVVLPFETNKEFAALVKLFYANKMRIGKLLEVMDFVAAGVCYSHLSVLGDHDYTVVTACIDSFQIFEESYNLDENLNIEAYLSYVGNRTMEVQVNVNNSSEKLLMSVNFLFVAKSPSQHGKSIPSLDIDNDEEPEKARLLFELGKQNQKRRIEEAKTSSLKVPPTQVEMQELHKLLLSDIENPSEPHLKMCNTVHKKTELSHHADRNVHGTVFGGTLMKESYELAFITAYMLSDGNKPVLQHINDTQFYSPVPTGAVLNYTSMVNFIHDTYLSVNVAIDVIEKFENTTTQKHTNDFNVVFDIGKSFGTLMPTTYKDAMLYVQGKRKFTHWLN